MTSSARQVALVTGGTRGIGLGVARALAREGWDLALCGVRREADVTEVLEELRHSGAAVQYCAADVARADDRTRLVDTVRAQFGAVNALVNNAGRAARIARHSGVRGAAGDHRDRHDRCRARDLRSAHRRWPGARAPVG